MSRSDGVAIEAVPLQQPHCEEDDLESLKKTYNPLYKPDPFVRLGEELKKAIALLKERSLYTIRSARLIFTKTALRILVGTLIIFAIFLALYKVYSVRNATGNVVKVIAGEDGLDSADASIVGLVFYGRRQYVEILDCYLRQNLASNGGILDEVRFVLGTEDTDDLEWVYALVDGVEGYSTVELEDPGAHNYEAMWLQSTEPDTIYVKIDDDMLWLDDQAIPQLVHTLINHPSNPVSVLANLINSASLGWIRYHLGAIHSYLPELNPPPESDESSQWSGAWRASELPEWNGKTNGDIAPENIEQKHRWLPVHQNENIWTPIERTAYDAFGPDWTDWRVAAQKHYSFLEDLETGKLDRYNTGEDGTWDLHGHRGNINLMAIRGGDVRAKLPFDGDDEQWFSVGLPARIKRPCLVQTRSLAAHYAFGPQKDQLDKTDIFDRYLAYAGEMVCKMKIPEVKKLS